MSTPRAFSRITSTSRPLIAQHPLCSLFLSRTAPYSSDAPFPAHAMLKRLPPLPPPPDPYAKRRPPPSSKVNLSSNPFSNPSLSPSSTSTEGEEEGEGEQEPESADPRRLRNDDIPYPVVRIVDKSLPNGLSPPQQLSSLLASLNKNKEFVQLLNPDADPPVVRVMSFDEEKRLERERKARIKAARASNKADKEVQFTWGVSASDLARKLDKVKEALGQRRRVSVLISLKPGVKEAPSDTAKAAVERKVYEAAEGLGIEAEPLVRKKKVSVMVFRPKPVQE